MEVYQVEIRKYGMKISGIYFAIPCCAMLCYAMLCHTMLCYAMLCHALLCYAMPCYAMLCYAMLCYAMLCYAMLCYAMLCYAMLCYAMLCYAMLCYATICYAMLCYAMIALSYHVNPYLFENITLVASNDQLIAGLITNLAPRSTLQCSFFVGDASVCAHPKSDPLFASTHTRMPIAPSTASQLGNLFTLNTKSELWVLFFPNATSNAKWNYIIQESLSTVNRVSLNMSKAW